ncbi:hypothetical protein T492DRAFT_17665 [Pavlovales sp. CCMP2436]|nr:hypothetical protein T492DRAFT_17665 [Pavlovales sp. CCMP2436]
MPKGMRRGVALLLVACLPLVAVRALVPLEIARHRSSVAAAGLVARVRPIAAVPALVVLEVNRLSCPVAAARLVARVRRSPLCVRLWFLSTPNSRAL